MRLVSTARSVIGDVSPLSVPNMNWEFQHRFETLKGADILNGGFEGWHLLSAQQDIGFQLSRSGAIVESESGQAGAGALAMKAAAR